MVRRQRSNQLNYVPAEGNSSLWWALKDLNLRPFGCKPNALTAELSALLSSSYRKQHEASTHAKRCSLHPERVTRSFWPTIFVDREVISSKLCVPYMVVI